MELLGQAASIISQNSPSSLRKVDKLAQLGTNQDPWEFEGGWWLGAYPGVF